VKIKHLIPVVSVAIALSACQGKTEAPVDAFQLELPVFYLERPADALTVTDPRSNFNVTAINGPEKRAGNLFLKLPGQDPINITGSLTAATVDNNGNLTKDVGDVMSPSLNYDGSKLIFSLFEGNLQGVNDPALQNHWDLWEYEFADPTNPNFQPNLHKLFDNNLVARVGNDLDPVYLPDGRIVFTSDRQASLKPRFGSFGSNGSPYLDENRQENALNLHIIGSSGNVATMRQLSTNMADERFPTVISDGRIVFSRWELSREAGKTTQFDLFSIFPDGSHLQILYGGHSHGNNAASTVFYKPQQLPDGRLLTVMTSTNGFDPNDITTINQSNFGGGDLVFVDYNGYADINTPRDGGSPIQGVGHMSGTPGNTLSGPGLSTGGRYENFSPIWQGSDDAVRVLVSWSPCRVASGTAPNIIYSVCDKGGDAARDPIYGLHILNLSTGLYDGEFALPPAGSGVVYVDPVVVTDRTALLVSGIAAVPAILQDHNGAYFSGQLELEGVSAVHIRSVYDSDRLLQLGLQDNLPAGTSLPMTAAGQPDINSLAQANPDTVPVRFVRLISPMMSFDNNNVPGYKYGVNGRRMRSILGYAPVQPDGSVFVKVPANVPFAFELLDKDGQKLVRQNGANQFHGSWLNTMPGEIVTCNGCHEGHSRSAPLNSGFTSNSVSGVISTAAQSAMNASLTNLISGGETMAQLLVTAAAQQPPLIDATYTELKRDLVYQDYWTNPAAATPGTPIAIEYNDRNPGTDNQGLIYTAKAPIINNTCAPSDFTDSTDQPPWNVSSCMITIDYLTHIQPMWEATRPISSTANGACIDCHSTTTIDAMTNLPIPQVPAGETQLDLTVDGNGQRFINNDNDNRAVSYEEMVHRGFMLRLNAMGDALEVVTTPVPDGNGGTIDQPVQVPGTLAIGTNREARNSRLIRVLTDPAAPENADPNNDHSTMMTDAEIRVLVEWIDLGLQYFNNSAAAYEN